MLRIVALLIGLAVAAWGGVIAYRAFFLEPATTVVITGESVREYPDMMRAGLGLLMLVCGACLAFFASRRRPM
jgi:uncharacterized membrane protein